MILGDATDIRYQAMINCDLQMVGDEFSRKPYAIAVQQGSPLKDQFNNACVLYDASIFNIYLCLYYLEFFLVQNITTTK